MEQHAFWTAKYADFPAGGPYSQEAYRIFPRYRLADDTLVNIERCVFDEATSSKEALDSELARPVYDGSESFLFRDSDWLVYASHESSLTLAGSIADFFRERWSDADSLGYGGPFHTDDLRGTWKWPT